MRAILLSAGRGMRLRPITDVIPKPLLEVQGKTLLEHQLDHLQKAGIKEVVINISWLAQKIEQFISNGDMPISVRLQYEPEALETGGGIAQALPWLCQHQRSFIVINADILHNFAISKLLSVNCNHNNKAHLVLSPNLLEGKGDFNLDGNIVRRSSNPQYVFTGISRIHLSLFEFASQVKFPLVDMLNPAIDAGTVKGILHNGKWSDVGSPEMLSRAQVGG